MKTQILIFLIAVFLIPGCQSPRPQEPKAENEFEHLTGYHKDSVFDTITGKYVYSEEVNFGQDLNWVLQAGESEGAIDSLVVEEYFRFNDVQGVQLPLNRYVVSDNYRLFIGIVMGTTPEAMAEQYQVSDSAFVDMNKNDEAIRILSHHDNAWSVRYLMTIDRTYLFSYVSEDSVFIYQKFENYESPSDCIIAPEL